MFFGFVFLLFLGNSFDVNTEMGLIGMMHLKGLHRKDPGDLVGMEKKSQS